jgi:glyoxylase-like metal-dependent hydrolase (beta-lactamase superfamily II)
MSEASHGSTRIGPVRVVALCDAVVASSESIGEAFPRVPSGAWPRLLAAWPDTVAEDGRWRLHVHCFLVRTAGRTILFDAGIGPATAPAFAWSGTEGALLDELAASGAGLSHVDDVVISHVHDDHLGWTATPDGRPRFPNARYIVNSADLDALREGDQEDRDVFAQTIEPLEAAGVLEASDERMPLGPGLELVRAAGHTPGHQVLVIDDGDASAILSADVTNHPALVEDASWSGITDSDPELAATTRAELLEIAERDGRIWIGSHLPVPFVRIRTEDGRRRPIPL